ncbi:S8 family peptidase [Paenibacillus glycinis]|uniref:S8 family serine peptidase n=1 Tax=Paenibacillus glycinis TaxID=2697035 RepID=A0ABW9XW45_9BACL|nr:S8 family serine peptidase [Paenibacillus glycinis]NBD26751.1 S8 family serine peptidase [Paenibacillus glycinis]
MINRNGKARSNSISSKPGSVLRGDYSVVPVAGKIGAGQAARRRQRQALAARFARLALRAALAALLLAGAPAEAASLAAGAARAAQPPAAAIGGPDGSAAPAADGGPDEPQPRDWLIKWRDPAQAKPLPGTRVLRRLALPEAAVDVVRPADPGADTARWLLRLQHTPELAYAEPVGRVHMLAAEPAANDPELPKQQFLAQIGAADAWTMAHDQTDLTIALIDTGVDLDHPDLKDNLVPGTNLVSPGKPPEDDNGHGTAVAGVIAGEGNNKLGVAGILWHAKIMPVKALDADGYGDEERLGEAITYAVDHGARILVLSVGLYRYSPYLKDIAAYAESKGALLVAASGNDGELLGSKAKVKYPAAYPTVMAVAGATADGAPETRSNAGPEIDLAAPWSVYTTALGGGYKQEEGTSMAAPQAAAAAALVWAVHPGYKPYQVRALLRQSAKDIGNPGFDNASGYGLLRIDKAVTAALQADAFEPNDDRQRAKLFPLGTKIAAELAGAADTDWYRVEAPYDGTVAIQVQSLPAAGESAPTLQLTHAGDASASATKDIKLGNQTVEWHVKKGRNDFEVRFFGRTSKQQLAYLLTSSFENEPDAYETNDKQYQAFALKPVSQQIVGNFHQTGDQDWFAIRFETGGMLKLSLTADSARMDPGLAYQRQGGALTEEDENGEGEGESSPPIDVTPGTYYIRVHNAASAQASPTASQYKLNVLFITRHTDPNEPNDRTYEATGISPGAGYSGVIGAPGDVDWYQLRLTAAQMVTLKVSGIPAGIAMRAELLDKRQKSLYVLKSAPGASSMTKEARLDAGLYYVKLSASAAFDKQYYGLRVKTETLVAGFRDIDGHWAESAIVALNKKGIVGGSGNYRFGPDQGITRAEAVSMLVRAFKPAGSGGNGAGFRDVGGSHWAYSAIAGAARAGWIGGYPGGIFGPGRPISREEMAVILLRALNAESGRASAAAFDDVPAGRWSAPAVRTVKQMGLMGGYPGNRFEPERSATRAEFASVLLRALSAGI